MVWYGMIYVRKCMDRYVYVHVYRCRHKDPDTNIREVCVYVCVDMCKHRYMYGMVYVRTCMCRYVYMHVGEGGCICTRVQVHIYICIRVCTCIYIYIYVCVETHT